MNVSRSCRIPLALLLPVAVLVAVAAPAAAHPANILAQDFAIVRGFEPPSWPMAEGGSVSFGNFDTTGALHHPISNDDDAARVEGGGLCFDAGVLDLEEIVWVTPACTGIVTYRCDIHPWMRATLRIS